MNYTIYIFTYGKFDLACGAAKSIKKFCEHDTKTILIDASQTINSGPFDQIEHAYFPKWMGWGLIRNTHNGGPGLCVDDDMRLLTTVSLKDRYSNGNYKAPNGSMIIAWNDIKTLSKIPYNLLKQKRMNKNYKSDQINDILLELGSNTKAEHIDDVWLHIDKGSEQMIPTRQLLIDYVDNEYYGDGDSQLVSS